ncbi:MAG TPA: GAF domain-containing protein [Thermomicrobiales bacterium]|nr:GAF domain-containing protein [Thermomicrobiales bacterium]
MSGLITAEPAALGAKTDTLRREIAHLRVENERLRSVRGPAAPRRAIEAAALALVAGAATSLALPDVLAAALDAAAAVIPCDLALVTLVNAEGTALQVAAARGAARERYLSVAIPVERGYNGEAFRTRRPLLVRDANSDARRYSVLGYTETLNNVLCVPLVARDRAIGTLYLARSAADSFADADLRLLAGIADPVALAVDNAQLFAGEQRRRAEAEALATVAGALGAGLAAGDTLRVLAEQALVVLGARRCGVWDALPRYGALRVAAWAGLDPAEEAALRHLTIPVAEVDWLTRALAARRVVAVDEVGDELPAGLVERFGMRSFIAVAIPGPEGVLGTLYVDQGREGRRWTAADRHLAAALAGQAGIALTNARLYETERRRAAREAALREIGREVSAELDLARIAAALRRHLCDLTGLDNCWLALADAATGAQQTLLWVENGQDLTAREAHVALVRGGMLEHLLRERTPVLTDDHLAECSRRGLVPAGPHAERPGRAWLGLPLVAGGRAIGALCIWRWDAPIPPEVAATLEALVGQLATALEHARLYAEAERQRREEAALSAIAGDLAASLDQQTVLQRIADHARRLFAGDIIQIVLHDPATGLLRCAAGICDGVGTSEGRTFQPDEGVIGYCWSRGRTLNVADYHAAAGFAHSAGLDQFVAAAGMTTVLGAPIVLGDERLGVLLVGSRARRAYRSHDEALLTRLATQAALAVRNARLYAAAHQRATRLELLAEIGRELSAELDFDRFLDRAWRQLTRLVNVENCWLGLQVGDGGDLDYCLFVADGARTPEWETVEPGTGLGRALLIERATICVPDYIAECRRRGLTPSGPAIGRPGMAWLGVPLLTGGRTVGAMAVWRWSGPFSAEDAGALEMVMGQVAAALENARLYDEARRLARTDPLTGLLNRRALQDRLDEEVTRAAREGHSVAVAMLDLDHFKQINDTYGHPAGDRLLRVVAEALRAEARPGDAVGRFGGDEFVLVLPATGPDEALALLARARARLATAQRDLGLDGRIALATSAGIARYPDDVAQRYELIALADAALYASKGRGGAPVLASELDGRRQTADGSRAAGER